MEPVRIFPYDSCWPRFFESERTRVKAAAGGRIEIVEHVGSTAVPGLDAKPVIDLLAGVRSLADAIRCVQPLERIGYEHRGEAGVPGRIFLRTYSPCICHLNLAVVEEEFWEGHLLFRDYLRAHPDTAREYARLKHKLAVRFRYERESYTEAKTGFVEAVLERARAWRD